MLNRYALARTLGGLLGLGVGYLLWQTRNGCRALQLARLASTGLDRGERAAAPFTDADLQRTRVGTVPTFETRRSLSSVSV